MTSREFTLAAPVTFDIDCRTGPGPIRTHAITVHPDWSVTTPHDTAAEAIAAAFGGRQSCTDLPRVIDAVRTHIAWNLRQAPYPIVFTPRRGWDVPESRSLHPFPSVFLAAAFVRSPHCAAARHDVPLWQVETVADGLGWWWSPLADGPETPAGAAALVREHDGLSLLWESGIHPDDVVALADRVQARPDAPAPAADFVACRYPAVEEWS